MSDCKSPHYCPECLQGKHKNCDGTAWCPVRDERADCTCIVCEAERNAQPNDDDFVARLEASVTVAGSLARTMRREGSTTAEIARQFSALRKLDPERWGVEQSTTGGKN